MLRLLPAPAIHTLDLWRRFVETGDRALLDELFADDVIFRSPFVHKPYAGAATVRVIIGAVSQVLEDVVFDRELESATDAVWEFKGHIGDIEVHGVDLFRFNAAGKISAFEVMVRPHKALTTLSEKMGAILGSASRQG
jgi:hypothetical protein